MSTRHVFLDHAATTPLNERVLTAMMPYLSDSFGNPSAIYLSGRTAKTALADARATVAGILGAKPEEIIFTGSGTEANALALFGVLRKHGGALVTATTEHHAILNNARQLEKDGMSVTYVGVDRDGFVKIDELATAITSETTPVSIMYANNETGTIAPMADIARAIKMERERRKQTGETRPIYFHTDACQAAGYLPLNVRELGVDLMTMNGSKIYGPKGIGALYVRKGILLSPLWHGGGQENRLRSGTENVAGVVGFAEALKITQEMRDTEGKRLTVLRDYFISELFNIIPKIVLNGPDPSQGLGERRIPNNVNISILDIEGEAYLLYLDHKGIEASTGSACDSVTLDPSHVILALGRPYEYAHASLRFTLGRHTTKEDIDYVLSVMPGITTTLRKISPISLPTDGTGIASRAAFAGQGMPHWEVKNHKNIKSQDHEITKPRKHENIKS